MASNFPGWTFDPQRGEYYYFNAQEQCWIYQSGRRIHTNEAGTGNLTGRGGNTAITTPADPQAPRSKISTKKGRNIIERAGQESDSDGDDGDDDELTKRTKSLSIKDSGGYVAGPKEDVTDPELLKVGLRAKGLLTGNYAPKGYQKLHPGFKTRKPGKKFFIRGRVFKALWPETLGDANESVTTTRESRFGEEIATKIRWFVVVKEGHNFCTCLPIVTYNRQGVAKPGVIKENHAIAFSSGREPAPEPNERARLGENPMLPGIKIEPRTKREKLDQMARIDFSRMYTVEHKIKAYYFGNVANSYLERLIQQWVNMIAAELTESLTTETLRRSSTASDDENSDEDDDDDEDEDDDGDEGDDDDDDRDAKTKQGTDPSQYRYGPQPAYPGSGYPTGDAAASQYSQTQYPAGQYSNPAYPNPQYPGSASYPGGGQYPSSYGPSSQYNTGYTGGSSHTGGGSYSNTDSKRKDKSSKDSKSAGSKGRRKP